MHIAAHQPTSGKVSTYQAPEPMERVEYHVGGDGVVWERDSRPFFMTTPAQMFQFMAQNATFDGIPNPNYDPARIEPSGFIPQADKPLLRQIENLGKEAGIEWLYSFEKMGGVNRFRRSHEGFEMSFDNGSPDKVLTPEGSYSFGSSVSRSDSPGRFMQLLEKHFEIETVIPKKSYIPEYSITGPLLRLTPKK
jgi:hypothetical protein